MLYIIILAICIVIGVLVLSVITINKGYSYEHKVDTPDQNPYMKKNIKETEEIQ